jgi:hypothetical protein
MTFDHVFVDIVAEQAVDVVEDLRLGDPAPRLLTKYSRMRRSRRGSGSTSPATSGSRPSEKRRSSPTRPPSLCPRRGHEWLGCARGSRAHGSACARRRPHRRQIDRASRPAIWCRSWRSPAPAAPADQFRKHLAAGTVARPPPYQNLNAPPAPRAARPLVCATRSWTTLTAAGFGVEPCQGQRR